VSYIRCSHLPIEHIPLLDLPLPRFPTSSLLRSVSSFPIDDRDGVVFDVEEGFSTPMVGRVVPHGIQPREIFLHISSEGDGGRCAYVVFIKDNADAAG